MKLGILRIYFLVALGILPEKGASQGLIGGYKELGGEEAYAALVAQDGSVT
jgi:hypothetical protein